MLALLLGKTMCNQPLEPVAEPREQAMQKQLRAPIAYEKGAKLGPYEILDLLGRGGMGQVYRARDHRLGREVAIKVLAPEVAGDPDRLARFEREARAIAALNHPNILTVFDVGTHEHTPYAVTELLHGESLRDLLLHRMPTQKQALGFSVQIATALEAAHSKGVIHRDIKPANVFITFEGRVKLLDFGLAKLAERGPSGSEVETASTPTHPGKLFGTLAYMSPEQLRGLPLDERTDIFSFGVLLYELFSGKHPFLRETVTATLTAILLESTPDLASVATGIPPALSGIVRRCLEKDRDQRFRTAHDLAFSLEAVLASPTGSIALEAVEERSPYPGLMSFTEKDAAFFFGREAEVKALWEKIRTHRLLAVIGPSGAGKTSFMRAGVISARPEGWSVAYCTPSFNPAISLARGLTSQLSGDAIAMSEVLDAVAELTKSGETSLMIAAFKRWRATHTEVLLILDQFEELFTLNSEEIQQRFSVLIDRLAGDAGIHIVITVRDDFLLRCCEQQPLAPILKELTVLLAMGRSDLERAVSEPSKKRGYSFEDEALVDEMVKSVEGVRGALPLLAFAVSRLWEKRDRERKMLTRNTYEEIGGVAGAIAQHAEAMMERIGSERQDMVREIFRNLVTAHGTRAVCDRQELLTAFPDRSAAEDVLRQLIDARLLTSYEVENHEGEVSRHRIEVVHESLLRAWPRLVRWQSQDEEGALLRDQLKQAAHLWMEKGRTKDLLWTGVAYREFELWHDRYTGALTLHEEEFAKAMRDKARRKKRLLTTTVVSVIAALTGIAIAIGISRSQTVKARDQARVEAARSEASKLLSLGRLKLADSPSAALAYAIASLERSDNDSARRFAVEALWHGPPALFLDDKILPVHLQWSPDMHWLALGGLQGVVVLESGVTKRRHLSSSFEWPIAFTSDSRWLVTKDGSVGARSVLHVWSLPEGRLIRTLELAEESYDFLVNDQLFTFAVSSSEFERERPMLVRRLSLDGKTREVLGAWNGPPVSSAPYKNSTGLDVDARGVWFFSVQGSRIVQHRLNAPSAPGVTLGNHEGDVGICVRPWSDRIVTGDNSGEVRIWAVTSPYLERTLRSPADARRLTFAPGGRFIATGPLSSAPPQSVFLFDLARSSNAEPVPLLGLEAPFVESLSFSPDGNWLAATRDGGALILWSTATPRSTVLGRQKGSSGIKVAFTPDGRLLSTSDEGILRIWSLSSSGDAGRQLWSQKDSDIGGSLLEVDPKGRFVVMAERHKGEIIIVQMDGSNSSIHQLKRPSSAFTSSHGSMDPGGRLLAINVLSWANPRETGIRILDLASGEERNIATQPMGKKRCEETGSFLEGVADPVWLHDGRLITDGDAGLLVWNVKGGTSVRLRSCRKASSEGFRLVATPNSRKVLRLDIAGQPGSVSSLSVFDIVSRTTGEITSHGNMLKSFAIDSRGAILVTGDRNGLVRVGPLNGNEPHLLFGHTGSVSSVSVSPDRRWIASGSDDGSIRVWPMPDLSKPPLHTLPLAQLLARLRSLTNLRAVRDPESDTGSKIEIVAFPGWTTLPWWQP